MLRKLNHQFKAFLRKIKYNLAKIYSNIIISKKAMPANCDFHNLVKSLNIKNILFIRADGKVGDMVISTFIFREIKKFFPNIQIDVLTKGSAIEIIKYNPNIDNILIYPKSFWGKNKLAKKIKNKYDLSIDFYEDIKATEIIFLSKIKAKYYMGIDKTCNWNMYNFSLNFGKDFEASEHVSKRYIAALNKLGIPKNDISTNYEIFFDFNRQKEIENLKNNKNYEKLVVVNPFGASKHRSFNASTMKKILDKLKNKNVLLLYYSDLKEKLLKYRKKYDNIIIPTKIDNILDAAMYVAIADIVISPDTSIIHIARTFNKKIIGFYEYDGGILGSGHIVWGPNDKRTKFIFSEKRKSIYDNFDINNFKYEDFDKIFKEI